MSFVVKEGPGKEGKHNGAMKSMKDCDGLNLCAPDVLCGYVLQKSFFASPRLCERFFLPHFKALKWPA
jgi:hypothetical protein